MSEMVEKVATALAASFRETVAMVSGDSWEETGVTLPSKEVWERYARAAIKAMREPTDVMIDAAWPYGEYPGPSMDHFKIDLRSYWYAEIDEALK